MKCETYERLRLDAAEDAAMQPHVDGCAACQGFHQAVQAMDADLPGLWAPELPADFTANVVRRARVEGVLHRRPWYERWWEGEDAVSLRQAVGRAVAYGGLVGGLAGVMGAAGAVARYMSAGDRAYGAGRFHPNLALWATRVHDALPGLASLVGVMTLLCMLRALRLGPLWRKVRSTERPGRWPLLLQALLGGAAWAVVWEAVVRIAVLGWEGAYQDDYFAAVAPQWANMVVWASLSVATLLLMYYFMRQVASGAPALAAVFYGGLLLLLGIHVLWQSDSSWMAWTLRTCQEWRTEVRLAASYYSPVDLGVRVGAGLALMLGGCTGWLVLLRESAASTRWARSGAMVLGLGGLCVLYTGWASLHLPGAPWPLSPGPRMACAMLAMGPTGMQQGTVTVHSWESDSNEAVWRQELAGSSTLRRLALRQRMTIEWLHNDPLRAQQSLCQAMEGVMGLGENDWYWEFGIDPDTRVGETGRMNHRDSSGDPDAAYVEGVVRLNGRAVPRVRVSLFSVSGGASKDPASVIADAAQAITNAEHEIAAPGDDSGEYSFCSWQTTDAEGHFLLGPQAPGRWGWYVEMPSGVPITFLHPPALLDLKGGQVVHLGGLDLVTDMSGVGGRP